MAESPKRRTCHGRRACLILPTNERSRVLFVMTSISVLARQAARLSTLALALALALAIATPAVADHKGPQIPIIACLIKHDKVMRDWALNWEVKVRHHNMPHEEAVRRHKLKWGKRAEKGASPKVIKICREFARRWSVPREPVTPYHLRKPGEP